MTSQSNPLVNFLGAGIETISNQFLDLDSASRARRAKIEGKVISIKPTPFPKLHFVVSKQQIDVLSHFEGESDCALNLSPQVLLSLAKRESISDLIKSEQLEVHGDIKAAQRFADLFLELETDTEGRLARYVGDVLAYQIMRQLRLLAQGLKHFGEKTPKRISQISSQEWQLHVESIQFDYFKRDIAQLNLELEALDKRIGAMT